MFDSYKTSFVDMVIQYCNTVLLKASFFPPYTSVGVAPGAMIHVKVPGEDRLTSALPSAHVPRNTSEFHVSYHPYPQKYSQILQVHVLGQ